jgi:hypothetical protein
MRIVTVALIVSLFTLSTGNAFAQNEIEWHKVASSIPLGSKVKVQMLDGKRVGGTLVRVDDTSVQIKRNVRRPEAAAVIAFDRISNLEKDNGGGMSWAKALGIGLGVGIGSILTVFVIALQLD